METGTAIILLSESPLNRCVLVNVHNRIWKMLYNSMSRATGSSSLYIAIPFIFNKTFLCCWVIATHSSWSDSWAVLRTHALCSSKHIVYFQFCQGQGTFSAIILALLSAVISGIFLSLPDLIVTFNVAFSSSGRETSALPSWMMVNILSPSNKQQAE